MYTLKQVKEGVLRRYRGYIEKKSRINLQKNKGLWDTLELYRTKSGSTGCEYANFYALYSYIRSKKPLEILECGTGISTIVMAYAIMENEVIDGVRGGHITSMENIDSWYIMACNIMPEQLKKYVDIRLSPMIDGAYSIFRGKRYKDVPKKKYDFVFIDGPVAEYENGDRGCCIDFLYVVLDSERPITGFVDKLASTCLVYWHIFGSKKVGFDYLRGLGVMKGCSKQDLMNTQKIGRTFLLKNHLPNQVSSMNF